MASATFGTLLGCSPSPIRVGDLPECERDDPVSAAGTCFEESFRELDVKIEPLHLLAGDFTGDDNLEALVIGLRDGPIGVELWPGSDSGPVGPPLEPMVTGCSAYPIAGPLLVSGRDDLLFPTCMPSVDVYPGGEAGFGAPVSIALPLTLRSTVIADADADGDIDLVALGEEAPGAAALAVIVRQSDGSLAPPVSQPVTGLAFDPLGLRPADFDGDRILDVTLHLFDVPGGLGYALGSGTGAFGVPVGLATELAAHTLATADFDGDGDDDLAFADDDARTACIWILDDLPEAAPRCWLLDDIVPAHMAAGDLDGDAVAEVILADATAARVWVWDVDIAADEPAMLDLAAPAPAELVALVDLQKDGALDLLAGHFAARTLSIRLGVP